MITQRADAWLTVDDLAAYSGGHSIRTIRRWMDRKDHPLPFRKAPGHNGRRLVKQSTFDAWLADEEERIGGKVKAPAKAPAKNRRIESRMARAIKSYLGVKDTAE